MQVPAMMSQALLSLLLSPLLSPLLFPVHFVTFESIRILT